ncbi:MAG: hypothetical protein NXI01_03205 [Gammaproteobacteria bacterium]|nr:hypothetical protein [Gammaproteobacteria bacterium]
MSDWSWIVIVIVMSMLGLAFAVWPFRKQRAFWLAVPMLLILVSMAYWIWGAGPDLFRYEQQRAQEQKSQELLKTIQDPEVLVQRLQTHLQTHPKSAKGWYLLGRLFASQQRWALSLEALEKAYALKHKDALIAINYAEALFARHQEQEETQARQVLQKLLADNPQQMDALAMLAMDAQQRRAFQEAIMYWQRLLPLVPPQSEEAKAIRKAIVKLRDKPKDVDKQPWD